MNFPFGAPVAKLRQSPIAGAQFFFLGVYASAVHARWLNPDGSPRHGALAVASEPCIFWRGEDASAIVEELSASLPAGAGSLKPASSHLNGPSGVALDDWYLGPLGLTRSSAWLCDLLPESRTNAGQAAALAKWYEPVREALGLPEVSMLPVPTRFANDQRVEEIVEEFLLSGATTLVTLGDKPLEEFAARLRLVDKATVGAFGRTPAHYGRRHPFVLRGRRFELLPLVHPRHPGQIGTHVAGWRDLHRQWAARQAPPPGRT